MGNHFHLIIRPQKNENLSRIMQWILSVFALKFNRLFTYSGHVWYDRFTSKIINDSPAKTLISTNGIPDCFSNSMSPKCFSLYFIPDITRFLTS